MTTQAQAATVRQAIVVEAPVDRAFRVFTEQMNKIKPREHNMLGVDIAETVFEPRAGGRIYDRGTDGSECEWASVIAYEPPDRVVFSWNINPYWQVETDPARRSEVEVRFIAEGPDRTRLELEHRHLDRHGDGWEGVRDGVAAPDGWPLYLQRYADLLNG
jgi:uncharacterized protein YndB with AHSA1/START domain